MLDQKWEAYYIHISFKSMFDRIIWVILVLKNDMQFKRIKYYSKEHFKIVWSKMAYSIFFNIINQDPKFLILCIVPISNSLILNQIVRETFTFSSLHIFSSVNKSWKNSTVLKLLPPCILFIRYQLPILNLWILIYFYNELLYSYIYTSEKR